LTQDDNTNGESVNADLSVGIVSSTQVNSEPDLQLAGSDIGIALVLGVDLLEDNDVQPVGEDVDSECFESCQRQLIIEQLTDTLRVPHGPPGADGVLTSLDDVQLEYLLSGETTTPESDAVSPLDEADLTSILDEAICRWTASGLVSDAGVFDDFSFVIADLPIGVLGQTEADVISIDVTADGHGWFVDPTPADDSEFVLGDDGRLIAMTDGPAAGRMDLLTVVLHELGHVVGFDHTDVLTNDGPDVMSYFVNTGMRLLANASADPFEPGVTLDVPAFLLADGANLNDVIDELLATRFDPTVDPNPLGSFVFSSSAGDIPNIITIGGMDLQIENVTLTFSLLSYNLVENHWDGLVTVEAPLAVLFPGVLDIVIVDDGFETPRRVESATPATLLGNGNYEINFTLSGDHRDGADILAADGYSVGPALQILLKNGLSIGDEIAVLNSNQSSFDDIDLADDTVQILVTGVVYDPLTKKTTVTVEYNFNPETGGAWSGGSVIAKADLDIDDDADLNGVGGTIFLGSKPGIDLLKFNTLEATDLGFPIWLDVRVEQMEMRFTDFRADDTDSVLRLNAELLGINTGNEFTNSLLRSGVLGVKLTVTGSIEGIEFDVTVLREAFRNETGRVVFARNPIKNISGITGEVGGSLFGIGSIQAGLIVKDVKVDSTGAITTVDDPSNRIITYAAVRGSIDLFADILGFGFNLAISELGPLQIFIFTDVNIPLDPLFTGLQIDELRGGIRFNSSLEDLQVRPPFGATAGTVVETGDALHPYEITLTVPEHNLKVGDEFRITQAGNPAYLSGVNNFVVTEVDGEKISYLVDTNPGAFAMTTNIKKITISDPFDLRDPGFLSTKDMSLADWEAQLDQQVVNQANGIPVVNGSLDVNFDNEIDYKDNGWIEGHNIIDGKVDIDDSGTIDENDDGTLVLAGLTFTVIDGAIDIDLSTVIDSNDDGVLPHADFWDVLFDKVTIEAGATLNFAPRIPESILNFEVDLFFDTTGKFLLVGSMNMFNFVTGSEQGNYGFDVPAKLFFDLSDLRSGNATFLSLMDVPYVPQNTQGIKPLLVYHSAVTFETLINGFPATLDAATGFPAGVGINVDDATVTDLSGSNSGPWEVTFTLADETVPSLAFAVNDIIVVVGSDPSSFNGTHIVTDVDDAAGTISFMIGTAVLNGGIDVDYDGDVDNDDTGSMGGIPVLQGSLDMDKNGTVDTNDDGEVFSVITDVNGNRRVVGYKVIDGFVDIDGDGDVAMDPDDVGVIGADPGIWVSGSVVANEDDLGDGFRIHVDGGVDLNIPFVTTLSLTGEATLDVTLPEPGMPGDARIDFSFIVSLSETHVGNIGLASGAFHVTMEAGTLDEQPRIEIWGAAILTTDFSFLEPVGLFASASGLLRINNTDEVKTEMLKDEDGNLVEVVDLPALSFALRLDGSVDFCINGKSVFLIEGIFVLEFSAEQGFNVAVFSEDNGNVQAATLRLGPEGNAFIEFQVFAFLAIRSDGFAAHLAMSVDWDLLGLASIEATAVFIVNTTGDDVVFEIPGGGADPNRPTGLTLTIPGKAPLNPSAILAEPDDEQSGFSLQELIDGNTSWDKQSTAGAYGIVFLDGSLNLLSVLELDVSGYVLLSESVFSLELNFFAGVDFLGLVDANASGTVFFSSQGEFQVVADLYVGFDLWFAEIYGGAHLDIHYWDSDEKGSAGEGEKELGIEGELRVGLDFPAPFDFLNFSPPPLTVGYDPDSGAIIVGIPYPVPYYWWPFYKWQTYSLTVARFTIDEPPPPVLGQVNAGVLTLNVGPDAYKRLLLVDEVNEEVHINQIAGTNTIRITMFGVTQEFENVNSILIDNMDTGDDTVMIGTSVTIPLTVNHFGEGMDRLSNLGLGVVIAYGDDGDDRLEGGSANDHLFGGAGNDFIDGKGGQDWIEGNDDSDTLIGGDDGDTITGGTGGDLIAGDMANVTGDETASVLQTIGSALGGNDTIEGGDGDDVIFGGSGNDQINGGAGEDVLIGDDGTVTISPEQVMTFTLTVLDFSGNDIIDGGADNDKLFGQKGEDVLLGGEGDDFLYCDGYAFGTETSRNILLGDGGMITVIGGLVTEISTSGQPTGGADTIYGNGGSDVVMGGAALDMIYGDAGDDILLGDTGIIVLDNGSLVYVDTEDEEFGGSDTIHGDMGNDIIIGGLNSSSDTLYGNAGDDIIIGDNGFIDFNIDGDPLTLDLIRSATNGLGGGDYIYGNAGSDVILGGTGGDEIQGDDDPDILIGDNADIFLSGFVPGSLTILGSAVNEIISTDTGEATGGADTITGNEVSDIIIGGVNGSSDTLYGNDGDDVILGDNGLLDFAYNGDTDLTTLDLIRSATDGLGGDDVIYGNAGDDVLIGGTGGDEIHGNADPDILIGDNADIFLSGFFPGSLTILGSAVNEITSTDTDTEESTGGADTITGNEASDIIIGGVNGSSDTLSGNDGDDVILGDNGVLDFAYNGDTDLTTLDLIRSVTDGLGGGDIIYGNAGDDVLIGGTGGDSIDGNGGKDLILGDNGVLTYTNGDTTNPRFRVLEGTVMYGETPGVDDGLPLIDRDSQFNDPAGIPQWTNWEVTLSVNSGGADYIAGGPDNDQIFGQGGNDIIQGDGNIDPLTDVNASREGGLLIVTPSLEDPSDGDDYIEGNDGDDIIFGNLGQDDIIGGSSGLFGLETAAERTDGEDMIFGGAGTELLRNETENIPDEGDTSHGRDSDMILGDNGNIFRIVGTDGFNYDDAYDVAIAVRAAELLDYTPGGPDYSGAAEADIGAADEIHGESGDDFIYGMVGDDILFGEGQDDDIIGGYGNDWISGGTGDDGVLGDDGRIYTSRNGIAEPLYGIDDLAGELDKHIRTPDKKQQATINVSGELKKTVNLTPFKLGDPEVPQYLDEFDPLYDADDIIFGGLGNDFLHGGDGDDAISGAEALAEYYDNPANPGDVLKYGVYREGEFGAYNKDNPLSKVYWDPVTGEFVIGGIVEFLLNFDHTEGRPVNAVNTDGDDVIFGDLGNDWLVGGTGKDHIYGGRGSDLLNADDNLNTAGGANNEPNGSETSYEDLAYGGAGRDVLIANISGDRLIDWVGNFNRYVLPYTSFGANTISRNLKPKLFKFLYDLSKADGADQTLGYSDDPRHGEPNGELGLVTSKDPDWEDQTSDG